MQSIELGVQCSNDISELLAVELTNASGDQVDQFELSNADGTLTTVLQVVQIATSLVSAVAPIVTAYIVQKKVKKIKFGAIEIENPTAEQWEHLWREYLSSRIA